MAASKQDLGKEPLLNSKECTSSDDSIYTVSNSSAVKTAREIVASARNTLKMNIVGITGSMISIFYGAYQFGSSGWAPTSLFCVGFGVVVSAWMMRENYLRDRDIDLVVRRAVTIDEKGCILARLDDLPSWVFFPETERVEWVNKILCQLWPYVGHYVKDMLKDTMEPSIRGVLPSYLRSFRFEKIILGDLPPRIGGIKVYQENVSRNEIIMDLDIRYAGDCNIQVAVKKLKAGIKDLQISGMLRVVFKPLVKTIPLVGGISVFFLNRPRIDFNLTNVANVFDIPGLGDVLRNAVSQQVAAMMVLPNKFPLQLIAEIPMKSLKLCPPAGILRLNIVEGRDLVKADVGVLGMGKSDPYAIITVGIQEFKTPVIKNTVFPKWNYYCEPVIDQFVGQNIEIEVMDEDQSSKDDFLGRVSVDISKLVKKHNLSAWLQLEDTKSGSIKLQSTWLTLSDNPDDLAQQLSEIRKLNSQSTMVSAILLVFLDSAKHLPNVHRGAEEPSAQVQLTVTGFKESSAIRPHTNDPIWEESFRFLLSNPEIQDLTVEITDTKSNKPIGMTRVHISRLLREKSMQIEEPFQLLGAGPNSKILMTLQLKILVPFIPDGNLNKKDGQKFNDKDKTLEKENTKVESVTADQSASSSSHSLSPNTSTIHNMLQTAIVPVVDGFELKSEARDSPISPRKLSPTNSSPVSSPIKTPSPIKKKTSSPPSLSGESIKSNRSNTGIIKIQLTIRYSIPRRRLVVVVHKAKNLPRMEHKSKPDPYVKIYLQPKVYLPKITKKKTQVCRNSSNPVFDESLEFDVHMSEVSNYSLDLNVVSKDLSLMFPRGKVLGRTEIHLSDLDLSKAITEWYDLDAVE